MPFTFAHAAVGWPIRRLPLVWSAFVLGTFAPDFEYFLQLAPQSGYGHHWPGVVTFSLPLGMLVFALYEGIAKRGMAGLLPESVQSRIVSVDPAWRGKGVGWWIGAMVCMAFGIITHLFWDGFTHADMWGAQLFPVLKSMVGSYHGHWITIAGALQLLSSAVGMAVLAIWGWQWYKRTPPMRVVRPVLSNRRRIALAMLSVSFFGAVLRANEYVNESSLFRTVKYGGIILLVSGIAFLWYQLLLLGAYLRVRDGNSGQEPDPLG